MAFPVFIETKFVNLCESGDLQAVQQYLVNHPKLNIHYEHNKAFRESCAKGHLHIAQWLLQTHPRIDPFANDFDAFKQACINGHLQVAQWLSPKTNIDDQCSAFRHCCQSGQLHVAQWLYSQYLDIIYVSNFNNAAFLLSCANGKLDVAQWIHSLFCPNALSLLNSSPLEAFLWACRNGHLCVAQWLYQVDPRIINSNYLDHAFIKANLYKHLQVVQWLCTLNPFKYCATIENNTITNYKSQTQHDTKMLFIMYALFHNNFVATADIAAAVHNNIPE